MILVEHRDSIDARCNGTSARVDGIRRNGEKLRGTTPKPDRSHHVLPDTELDGRIV